MTFATALANPRATFERLAGELGLAADAVPAFATADPVLAAEPDRQRAAAWEIGAWRRFFTPAASRWFRAEAAHGLASLTCDDDDDWQGECPTAS